MGGEVEECGGGKVDFLKPTVGEHLPDELQMRYTTLAAEAGDKQSWEATHKLCREAVRRSKPAVVEINPLHIFTS